MLTNWQKSSRKNEYLLECILINILLIYFLIQTHSSTVAGSICLTELDMACVVNHVSFHQRCILVCAVIEGIEKVPLMFSQSLK